MRERVGAPDPGRRTHVQVDEDVIRRARNGDEQAFNQIIQAYRRRVLGTVARLIGRLEDVEDVAQEVFVRLYFSLGQLRSTEVFEPWLYRLTANAALDYLRRKRRRRETRMADLSEQAVLLADAAAGTELSSERKRQAAIRELTDELLSHLPEKDRVLLVLKEVEGLSLKELERIFDVNENALKVRLFRARQRVLKAYEQKRQERLQAGGMTPVVDGGSKGAGDGNKRQGA